MRDLTPDDFGVLIGFFTVLLLAFAFDFHISRRQVKLEPRATRFFTYVSAAGEGATIVALALSWVAIFLPDDWENIDTWVVFLPGSIAILCAVILTGESVLRRIAELKQ